MVQRLCELLEVPSPTGFTHRALQRLEGMLRDLGAAPEYTRKGALRWTLPGARALPPRAVLAHIDTLGAMVKEIKHNGRLKLTQLGGYDWATVEGEYCTVHARGGLEITGTVVNIKQSTHVWGQELRDLPRIDKTLEVRLDALIGGRAVLNAGDVHALGIEVGDFVSWDPRTQVLENGYIKSRFLDNKAGVAVLLAVTKAALEGEIAIAAPITFVVTNFEEVGHGAAAGIPADTAEVIAVDMAAIGDGQTSSELHCTLCVKDSTGPYSFELNQKLRELATRAGIDLKIDIYPNYGSDASAAMTAGLEAKAALIGPGVDASHAYERTHINALTNTAKLLLEYLKSD